MKSFGPKFLYKDYYGKPIVENQIKTIQSVLPNAEIILVVGFLSEKILKYKQNGVRIVENQLYQTHNDTEDIRLALNNTSKENIITISADVVFNKYCITNILEKPCLVYDSKHQLHDSQMGLTVVDNQVTNINFDIHKKWCHISYFEKRHLSKLYQLCNSEHRSKYLFELINIMIDKNYRFDAIEPNSMRIHKIDNPSKLKNYKP